MKLTCLFQPGSDIFVSINALKLSRRNVLLREYSEKSASIMKSRSPDVIQKRLRELKYELIRGYCTDLIQVCDLSSYSVFLLYNFSFCSGFGRICVENTNIREL